MNPSRICFLVFLSCFFLWQDAYSSATRFRCVWNDDPSTTMTVIWDQISSSDARIYYGESDFGTDWDLYTNYQEPDEYLLAKGMNNAYARLKNLKPDTKYYFVIKDQESCSKRFWFRTAPNNADRPLSIIGGGDSRNNREARKKANLIVSKLRPDLVMFAGDMTASDIASQWIDWMNDWQLTITTDGKITPIIAARGNHEDSDYTLVSMFDVPHKKVQYALNFGGDLLRVYTLNSMASALGDQKKWLESDLAKNQQMTWRFAQYHHPIRPHTAAKSEREEMRRHWATLFHEHQVQMVLECDAHLVKTTWPVRPSLEDGHDEGFVRDDKTGTVYVGEGCWGAPLRPNNDDKSWTRASGSFNQVKWIFVSKEQVEIRTIKVDNARQVGSVSESDRFFQPYNLDIWSPKSGAVVQIKNRNVQSPPMPIAVRHAANSINIQDIAKPESPQVEVQFDIPIVSDRAGKLILEQSLNGIFFQPFDTLSFSKSDQGKQTLTYRDREALKHGSQAIYYRIYPEGFPEKAKSLEIDLQDWASFPALSADAIRNQIEVSYQVDRQQDVRLKVFNSFGQLIAHRIFHKQKPGEYSRFLNTMFWKPGTYLVLTLKEDELSPARILVP